MTGAQKHKYFCEKLLEFLAPYGYFSRHGALWKYSPQGQYVVKVELDTTRWGDLNDISIQFSSFFQPIKAYCRGRRTEIGLSISLELDLYLRAALHQPHKSPDHFSPFEEQLNLFLPDFVTHFFPRLQIDDSLADYLRNAEQLIEMDAAMYHDYPLYIGIPEYAYAYLYLNCPKDAERVLNHYVEQCPNRLRFLEDYRQQIIKKEGYDPGEEVFGWTPRCTAARDEAQQLCDMIRAGNWENLLPDIEQKRQFSAAVCQSFFHAK